MGGEDSRHDSQARNTTSGDDGQTGAGLWLDLRPNDARSTTRLRERLFLLRCSIRRDGSWAARPHARHRQSRCAALLHHEHTMGLSNMQPAEKFFIGTGLEREAGRMGTLAALT